MESFPIDKVEPEASRMSGVDGDVSIEIRLRELLLSADGYSEKVKPSIRLDGIDIPFTPTELENQTFDFPTNPEQGYIDGSIYFFGTHNPIDVRKISFGEIHNGQLPARIETTWVLEYERTGFKNFDSVIEFQIEL